MKKKLFKFVSVLSLTALFPILAFAQITITNPPVATCTGNGISNLICNLQLILNSIVPLLIALGVVYFVWGVVQYVNADGEEAKKKGKDRMIYGIIGFVVIVGLWGLVNIITTTFNIGGVAAPKLDTVAASTTCTIGATFQGVLSYVTCIINSSIIPLIFALAMVMFVWGVVNFFILNADDAEKRSKGKQFMIWGIVALAVMLSVWGLVNVLRATFNLGTDSILPQVHPPK